MHAEFTAGTSASLGQYADTSWGIEQRALKEPAHLLPDRMPTIESRVVTQQW